MRGIVLSIKKAAVVAIGAAVVFGTVPLADAATGFIDTVLSLPAPDGVKSIRTFDYRADGAGVVTGAGVTRAAFLAGTIPVGTVLTARYQSDVGLFEDAAGATITTGVGNPGSYEITAVATLTGTVVLAGPATLGVVLTGGSARMYFQNPGDRVPLAGTGFQDGALILAASGVAGSATVLGGSGGAAADFSSIDFCGGIILNCSQLLDFHFSTTLTAPPTSAIGAATATFFAVPPPCTGGAFCYPPFAVPGGALRFDADAFGRATGLVPAPATLLLLGAGLLGAAGVPWLRHGMRRHSVR